MTKNIRGKIDQETLNWLDSVAQVVAGLYVEQDEVSKLGQEVSELRSAVYTLGQAYMALYNAVLDAEEEPDFPVEAYDPKQDEAWVVTSSNLDKENLSFAEKWIDPHIKDGSDD